MEVRIGVTQTPREIEIEVSDTDRDKVVNDIETALAKGEVWRPLHGLPMTIKESYTIAGSPTTWGLPEMKDNVTDTSGYFLPEAEVSVLGAVIDRLRADPGALAAMAAAAAEAGAQHRGWRLVDVIEAAARHCCRGAAT